MLPAEGVLRLGAAVRCEAMAACAASALLMIVRLNSPTVCPRLDASWVLVWGRSACVLHAAVGAACIRGPVSACGAAASAGAGAGPSCKRGSSSVQLIRAARPAGAACKRGSSSMQLIRAARPAAAPPCAAARVGRVSEGAAKCGDTLEVCVVARGQICACSPTACCGAAFSGRGKAAGAGLLTASLSGGARRRLRVAFCSST